MAPAKSLTCRRITTAVGAVIGGVDLTEKLEADTIRFIRGKLVEHGVVFFRNQELSAEQMFAFGANFGKPIAEPFARAMERPNPVDQSNFGKSKRATAVWHTDTTFVREPPRMTVLRAVTLPPYGGDTLFASMYAAYEALSEPMRSMLDRLSGVHTMIGTLERMGHYARGRASVNEEMHGIEHVHPVVLVHPQTGRKALYISEAGMTRIVELEPFESAHILALLFEHVKSPDFNMRWTWSPNDVAIWDNQVVQHYAVPDYEGERVMQRVVLAGEPPRGPRDVL